MSRKKRGGSKEGRDGGVEGGGLEGGVEGVEREGKRRKVRKMASYYEKHPYRSQTFDQRLDSMSNSQSVHIHTRHYAQCRKKEIDGVLK